MPSSSFSLPFFLPQMVLVARNGRTNQRTNERALITGWRGTRSITHLFLSGVWSSGAVPPLPSPHPFLQPPMCVMRGGLRQRSEPPAHGCAQNICKNRQRKLSISLYLLPPKCVFPLLLPFGQWRQKKDWWGKGSLVEERRREGGNTANQIKRRRRRKEKLNLSTPPLLN